LAEWLGSGLQSRLQQFESARRLSGIEIRESDLGLAGVRRYLRSAFSAERNIQCWFGEPLASGDRAAVEWRASRKEGKVVVRDHDNHVERREWPYAEWSSA
jgi:hypothetical protein